MAKQNTEALFEESSEGAVSAVTTLVFVLSVVLGFGGILAASYSFSFDVNVQAFEAIALFIGGFIASTIGFALPFTILPAIGK